MQNNAIHIESNYFFGSNCNGIGNELISLLDEQTLINFTPIHSEML